MSTFAWLEILYQDLRYAARNLTRARGFLAVALLSLALGIGANTTIFSVVNAVLYRPLPYPHPDQLVVVWQSGPGGGEQPPPIAETVDWKKQNHVFGDIALSSGPEQGSMFGAGEPRLIFLQDVTPNYFSLLGVKPVLGRIFAPEEAQDRTQTVLIGASLWQRLFNRDPNVLGKTINTGGMVSTIVGVVPDFQPFYPHPIDVFQPVNAESGRYSDRADHWLMPVARLKPGVTRVQAQREMEVIARRMEQAYPATNKGVTAKVVLLHDELFGGAGQVLYPLFGAVTFVLLIACVNVANLFQSRTESRRKEYALRASLGAGRFRLVQQLLVESGLIALIGGLLGVVVSFWGIQIFRKLAGDFPNAATVNVDGRVLLFTLGLSLLTAILFGLAPAVQASNPDLNDALKEGGQTSQSGIRGLTRRLLAVSEVALAMVLLVGAGLMIDTVLRMQRVNPGFDPTNVIATSIQLPEGGKYMERVPGGDMEKPTARVLPFFQQVLEKVSQLPGVESAALINRMPTHGTLGKSFSILGRPAPPPDKRPFSAYDEVSSGLFRTLRIPLKKGRYIDAHDTATTPWVAVINEAFARRHFPEQDPIGQQLLLRHEPYHIDEPRPRLIVGVVGDIKHFGLGEAVEPFVYTSYLQQPDVFPGGAITTHINQDLVVRTSTALGGQTELARAVKKIVAELDPEQSVTEFAPMTRLLAETVDDSRFYMRVLGIFAGMAVLMAIMGVYGVMSYLVSKRTHEVGIRLALGARPVDVLRLFTGMGFRLALTGVLIGVGLSLGLTHVIASFLFGVKPTDPPTYAAVALALVGVALLASYIPARRATKVDPMITLRYQ